MVIALWIMGFATEGWASDAQVATVAQVEGRAQIFTRPSKKLENSAGVNEGVIASFEGEYYRVRDLKASDRVENGNVVRTFPGAKVKVIYDNGDQIYVGPGSSYRILWKNDVKATPEIRLAYGRIRGVISKEGPRKKVIIRTRSAVMGVRGTDFFISDEGQGETSVSVLRGAVEVAPTKGKPTVVETGMTAEVVTRSVEVPVRKISKEDLGEIRVASSLPVKKETQMEELKALEKKALEVTLKDIRVYQPELLKEMPQAAAGEMFVADLNSKVVDIAAIQAPSIPKKKRPGLEELKSPDGVDYYEKYFQNGGH
jgi:hypothetical protein